MRRRFAAVVPMAALLTAAGVSGCGSGGSPAVDTLAPNPSADVVSSSPPQALQHAVDALDTPTLRFHVEASVTFDTSDLKGAGSTAALYKDDLHLTGDGLESGAKRSEVTLDASDNSGDPTHRGSLSVVVYDGGSFVAADGGAYHSIQSPSDVTGGVGMTPPSLSQYLGDVGDATDAGQEVVNGAVCEHERITLDPTRFGDAFTAQYASAFALGTRSAATKSGHPVPAGLEKVIESSTFFKSGDVDVDLDHATGRLVRTVADIKVALSFDSIAQGLGLPGGIPQLGIPAGSLVTEVKVDMRAFDYGAEVTVQRPNLDPGAPAFSRQVGGFEI